MKEMINNYQKACKELYICLKNIDDELYNKIPYEVIKYIIENMDSDYYFHYDYSKKIYEQNFLEETKNLIGYIYYNYWANKHEKEDFKNIVINNSI